MSKFFIVIIDKEKVISSFDGKEFHKQIINSEGVKAWWHYLESTYIIKVDNVVNASHVANFIHDIAPKKKFFVTEIKLNEFNGRLPKEAWDWILENTNHDKI